MAVERERERLGFSPAGAKWSELSEDARKDWAEKAPEVERKVKKPRAAAANAAAGPSPRAAAGAAAAARPSLATQPPPSYEASANDASARAFAAHFFSPRCVLVNSAVRVGVCV